MNKWIAVVLAVLIVLGIWGLISTPAHTQQSPISEKDGLYFVGDKNLGAGYLIEKGAVLYTTRLQYVTGTSTPDAVRYDKFAIAGADAASFSMITDAKSENSESVYYQWGKDAQHIFYQGDLAQPLSSSTPTIDAANFSVLPGDYYPFGKDKSSVYEFIFRSNDAGTGWVYEALAGVDPATFAFIGAQCAEDKSSYYTIGYYGEFAATSTPLVPAACAHPGP